MRHVRLGSLLRSALAAAVIVPPVTWAVAACSDDKSDPPANAPPDGGDGGAPDANGDGGNSGCNAGRGRIDGGDPCTYYMPAPCGYDGGGLSDEECKATCANNEASLYCTDEEVNGERYIGCNTCAVGRRPDGFQAPSSVDAPAFGAYFATASALEAASVDAFRILSRELARNGAPRRLVRRAQRSARDEIRHTRITRKLARQGGAATLAAQRTRPGAVRPLQSIALENAVEGCVRETFGALVAMWQASHATDARVAAAMQQIAVDETRHAELAWSVARWVRGRLDVPTRARIDAAMAEAIDRLECELRSEPHPELVKRAGMPTARDAARLVDAMRERVWSQPHMAARLQ